MATFIVDCLEQTAVLDRTVAFPSFVSFVNDTFGKLLHRKGVTVLLVGTLLP